jgi:signal transduction histidine kinase
MPGTASERLKRNIEKIMKYWEERAYKEVSAAQHQEVLALRDSLPRYLDQLADVLSPKVVRSEVRAKLNRDESAYIGREHGRIRAASRNYTIAQVIFEYHILRQAVCDVLEEEAPLTPGEREIIVSSIEQAVNDAASQFSESLREIQETLSNTLAHDLRSPITAAKTSAQMILRRPDDADYCIDLPG